MNDSINTMNNPEKIKVIMVKLKLIINPTDKEIMKKILYISIYCFNSFGIRGLHSFSQSRGVDSYALFFKNSTANTHPKITDKEISLFREKIKEINPDLIGIGLLEPYSLVAKQLVREIKTISNVPIICGGTFSTVNPERALEFSDYACVGEGERVVDDIITNLKSGKDFRGIKGLWYKKEGANGTEVISTPSRKLIENLDELPFRALGDPNMYFIANDELTEEDPLNHDPNVWIMSARGCVYECSFCVHALTNPLDRTNGKLVRLRSVDNVIDEIESILKKYKSKSARKVFFADELFGTQSKWTQEFCEKYKARIGLPFFCEMIPRLIHKNNIPLLADAGMNELNFGIQSGSDDVRNGIMNRPGTSEEILGKIDLLRSHNVHPRYDLILGNPFEDESSLEETIKLLSRLPKPVYFNTFKMQYFSKYPFTTAALEKGYITEKDVTEENITHSVMNKWAFVPTCFSYSRRDYLESCIYLLSWNSYIGNFLAKNLVTKNSHLLGIFANILAYNTYKWTFGKGLMKWVRAARNAVRVVARGDGMLFKEKLTRTLRSPQFKV